MNTTTFRRVARVLAPIGAAALIAAGCGSDDDSSEAKSGSSKATNDGAKITLVGFSTPREAHEEIIPAFNKTADGEGVEFEQSYGASGEQSRAVEGGLPASVVHFALEPDVTRLVDAGLVADDWNTGEHKGIVSNSIAVLAVRKGNPKDIKDWDDLIKDDVEVITPNPFTSGGARWNLMAAYGSWTRNGAKPDEALDNLGTLLKNTSVQSKSAREALQVFAGGKGDVLIAYENEVIAAQQKGEDLEYVIPNSTILIENPAAVIENAEDKDAAQAYYDYLLSDDAQKVFGEKGFRPEVDSVLEGFDFETPKDLFTIEDVGGWETVMTEFFDRENGKVADIEKRLNVPTDA
ncbi:MAG: sulfate transporter, periplasmic sulfate-binding protein [Thermoleophilia bacterium]|nr:sulfate transporter, periplasmic sulfate-binding protein [Thermoleophilia bacterium]